MPEQQQETLFHIDLVDFSKAGQGAFTVQTIAEHDEGLSITADDGTDTVTVELSRETVGEVFNTFGAWLSDGAQAVEIDPVERMRIFGEVHLERQAQDAQWGGTTHDLQHSMRDWTGFIEKQIDRARFEFTTSTGTYMDKRAAWRARAVKIAALAVAAIEAIDHEIAEGDPF